MFEEATKFWSAIEGKVKKTIKALTTRCLQCERYDVTTAPNGSKIGVTQPFGERELFIPYSAEVSQAVVGDTVLVMWWNGLSTAKACFFGSGPASNYNTIVQQAVKAAMLAAHPVGSYYWSDDPTDPGTLFGGTWERIKDVFVLAAGDTYAIGANGGNPTHQHTLDAGYAKIAFNYSSAYANHLYQAYKYVPTFTAGQYWSGMTQYQTTDISETKASALGGTTDTASNMPPYIAAYCWKRIADSDTSAVVGQAIVGKAIVGTGN